MALNLVSLNVKEDFQYDTTLPFIAGTDADVVCLQELFERDIPRYEEVCGPCLVFAPEILLTRDTGVEARGNAIFSRLPCSEKGERFYVGSRETIVLEQAPVEWGTHNLVYADVEKEGVTYRFITTHGTWTPDGHPNETQLKDLPPFLASLSELGEFILTGDLNARRHDEVFDTLARQYVDNIPPEYETSIDVAYHRKKGNPKAVAELLENMVDCLFTTPAYVARDVRLQFGVSDHAAVIATVEKA